MGPAVGKWIARAAEWYDGVFLAPFRKTAHRSYSREEDLFMLICFSEWLGLPNPVTYYTLELYPYYMERFHQWHRRMGMERSPLDEIKCC
jgi:hypothetical protein